MSLAREDQELLLAHAATCQRLGLPDVRWRDVDWELRRQGRSLRGSFDNLQAAGLVQAVAGPDGRWRLVEAGRLLVARLQATSGPRSGPRSRLSPLAR